MRFSDSGLVDAEGPVPYAFNPDSLGIFSGVSTTSLG